MPASTHEQLLQRARTAVMERAWDDAFRTFSEVDAVEPLASEDLDQLALCAALTGRFPELLATWERLYEAQLAQSEPLAAALTAAHLAQRLIASGEHGRASAWLGRCQRLVDAHGEPSAAGGYLQVLEAGRKLQAGAIDAALASARQARTLSERFADRDLHALACWLEGSAELRAERREVALGLLDEAMLLASSGALSPIFTGVIYCSVIDCCQRAFALDRSREWTAALARWCDAQPQLVTFSGSCLLHRAEIFELGGAWDASIEQAERCVAGHAGIAGGALYQKAEIHRLRGELTEAEASYREASQRGRDPQPGLALLRLAQGEPALAAAAVRAALTGCADPLERARFLPACVEILLASGALEEACSASEELQALAARQGGEALLAIADEARARIALAQGHPSAALAPLRSALATWQKLDAPYIAARLRAQIANACEALSDLEGARLERDAARAAFERLGARLDLAALDACLGERSRSNDASAQAGLTPRELEVLCLLASGKTNKQIAKELFLSEKTIDRHVSNLFGKLEVGTRAAATAWAYEHGVLGRDR